MFACFSEWYSKDQELEERNFEGGRGLTDLAEGAVEDEGVLGPGGLGDLRQLVEAVGGKQFVRPVPEKIFSKLEVIEEKPPLAPASEDTNIPKLLRKCEKQNL